MRNKNIDTLEKAKNYSFLLLKFRPRSEKEIYQRLKKKKFADEIIKEVISFLKEKEFIDDNYFAKAWLESRLKKPLGLRRIRQELNLKGISKETIDNQIKQVKKDYREEDIVAKVAQEKFKKLSALEPEKAKRRIFSYLIRRGFSIDVASDTVKRL